MKPDQRAEHESHSKPRHGDSAPFRPIGIQSVNAAARQMHDAKKDEARRKAERNCETPGILRDAHDND
ncbi:hypothetical protein NK718_11145 [Alsobacter sp. SYSU M60028]|uniref:Uncharacterized protein n=1 Tax=Alsobacter ponti TaxID=2962936 RepID=A0ABT1LDA3_9HYPH|nr:hypothetical protein [Alsobacter ponti]MCP8939073.1 hypothetical protein [Alsobacter ponti]